MGLVRGTALVLVGLTLTACGGGSGEDGGEAPRADAGFADRRMDDFPQTPLSEFFGAGDLAQEDAQADFEEQERRAQELIRDCMVEQGFEYVPHVPDFEEISGGGMPDMSQLTQREYAEQYGYGISTIDYGATAEEPSQEDPNQALRQEMSESEGAAYDTALYGAPPEMPADADPETWVPPEVPEEQQGCQQRAYESAQGDVEELYAALEGDFTELEQRVQADERMVAALEAYGTCLEDAGYEGITEQYQLQQQFSERFSELQGHGADPFAGMSEEEVAALTPEEAEAMVPEQPEVEPEALAELREDEIAAAVADLGCREDLEETQVEVRREHEEAFVAEHRDVLDQIKAASAG